MKNTEAHEMLRSAYQIAEREGKDTNWSAFKKCLRAAMFELVGLADLNDEQTVLRVTCTARTFQIPPADVIAEELEHKARLNWLIETGAEIQKIATSFSSPWQFRVRCYNTKAEEVALSEWFTDPYVAIDKARSLHPHGI